MLTALKFVRGAVAKKDFQPALTHFLISDGFVMGYDGVIALCSPIDLDVEAAPKAIPFVKAIERCTSEQIVVNLTETGKLRLRSGRFRATIECTEEQEVLRHIRPEGEDVRTSDGLVSAFSALEPFIGTDASRPWAMGILLRGFSAYATNNIIVAEYWLGEGLPEVNLPLSAIRELTRIGEQPHRIQLGTNSVTFHFSGDRWLRSQLLSTDWPDVAGLFDRAFSMGNLQPFPPGFFEAIDTLSPFVETEGRILFREGCMTTVIEGGVGASVDIVGLPEMGAYHHKQLSLLKDRAAQIDFTAHPQPCPFVGKNLRGIFLGMQDL